MEGVGAILSDAKVRIVSLVPTFQRFEFNESGYQQTPRKPGVYLIFGLDGQVMYVGQTGILRDRMRQHADPRRQNQPLVGKTNLHGYVYSFYECSDRWWVEKLLQAVFRTNG